MLLLFQFEREMDKFVLPTGLLYLADALRQTGEEVKIKHLMEEEMFKAIMAVGYHQPKWIGLSVTTTPQLIPSITFSKLIKHYYPEIIIYWGGPHVRVVPDVLSLPYVDKVVTGFGEPHFSNKPFVLDDFKPAWDLLEPKYPDFRLLTTRGCPYRCSFCYNSLQALNKVYYHSVENIRTIIESYPFDYDHIIIQDDYFFGKIKRVKEIINISAKPWHSYGIRAPDLTLKNMKFLEKLPERLSMGIEHLKPRMLKFIQKDITVKQIINALDTAYKLDIPLMGNFITELPTETAEEREYNLTHAYALADQYPNFTVSFKTYRPYPGTKLYDDEQGTNLPRSTQDWADFYEKYKYD